MLNTGEIVEHEEIPGHFAHVKETIVLLANTALVGFTTRRTVFEERVQQHFLAVRTDDWMLIERPVGRGGLDVKTGPAEFFSSEQGFFFRRKESSLV